MHVCYIFFFFSSRRRHTRFDCDWSSDVCSSDLLLFAFNMLWAYFSFSQLLIIWSGNQPEEITFYKSRLNGSWGVVAAMVLVLHFFIPFFALLSRDVKRNQAVLPKIAMWLIAMRFLDIFWLTRPEFTSSAWPKLWDFAALFALGGIWLW